MRLYLYPWNIKWLCSTITCFWSIPLLPLLPLLPLPLLFLPLPLLFLLLFTRTIMNITFPNNQVRSCHRPLVVWSTLGCGFFLSFSVKPRWQRKKKTRRNTERPRWKTTATKNIERPRVKTNRNKNTRWIDFILWPFSPFFSSLSRKCKEAGLGDFFLKYISQPQALNRTKFLGRLAIKNVGIETERSQKRFFFFPV